MSTNRYVLKISRQTVEKLGVKLYDRAAAVISELVSNAYDADAKKVTVHAPMGRFLAKRTKGVVSDLGFEIVVEDNGIGMDPTQMQKYFLVVGRDRRLDSERGSTSPNGRPVTGRKGVGKLAPFGICRRMEVISSGGPFVAGQGYLTSHIVLDYEQINSETDEDYPPEPGLLDGTYQSESGTKIVLSQFNYKRVPTLEDLSRQLAQKFGLACQLPDWKMTLIDTDPVSSAGSKVVSRLEIPLTPETKLTCSVPHETTKRVDSPESCIVIGADGTTVASFQAGFMHEDHFYPVRGWIALSKDPYKDDIASGVRIYCRKKFAAQTSTFNRKSGFTGENTVKSYLVGELECDWLDEDEDLVSTDRRDILWSNDICEAFEAWGQTVVKYIGRIGRKPIQKKIKQQFFQKANVRETIRKAFPLDASMQLNAVALAELFGSQLREDELEDEEALARLVDLVLMLAPLQSLESQLEKAAEEDTTTVEMLGSILRTARVAEVYSLGRIVDDRIEVIANLRRLKNDDKANEGDFQRLIAQAPWLIDPRWVLLTENRSLQTVRSELASYLTNELGEDVVLGGIENANKRPDFVLIDIGGVLNFIEIKVPGHSIKNDEMTRIQNYITAITKFVDSHSNKLYSDNFRDWKITLVSDGVRLDGVYQGAFDNAQSSGRLKHIDWKSFLGSTEEMHKQFLAEADRYRKEPANA